MIKKKKTDQGLDSFYKTIEKGNEIPLDLSYLTESNHSNLEEENSQHDFSEILNQLAIPTDRNTNIVQFTLNVLMETEIEQFI